MPYFTYDGREYSAQELIKVFSQQFAITKSGELPARTIEEMLLDDAIEFANFLLVEPIRQQEWHIESKDKRQADFVQKQLEPLWDILIDTGIIAARNFGYEGSELVWALENSIVVLKDILPEPQESTYLIQEENGNRIIGLRFTRYGRNFEDIKLPLVKTCFFTWNATNRNPYGKSALLSAHKGWMPKSLAEIAMNRYYERRGTPPLDLGYPEDPNPIITGTLGENVEDRNETAAYKLAETLNKDSVWVHKNLPPEQVQWSVKEIPMSDRGASFQIPLNIYNKKIFRAMHIPDKLVTNDDPSGSYALQKGQKDIYFMTIQGIMKKFAHNLREQIIDKILALNFGDAALPCELVFEPFFDEDKAMYLDILKTQIQSGITTIDNGLLLKKVGIEQVPPQINTPLQQQEQLAIQKANTNPSAQPTKPALPQQSLPTQPLSLADSKPTRAEQAQAITQRKRLQALKAQRKLEEFYASQPDNAWKAVYKDIAAYLIDNAEKIYNDNKDKLSGYISSASVPKGLLKLDLPFEIFDYDSQSGKLANFWGGVLVATYLQGATDVSDRVAKATKDLSLADELNTDIDWYKLTPEQAIEFFKSKQPLTSIDYKALDAQAKTRAFSTATSETEYLSGKFQDGLIKALQEGMSQGQWVKYVQKDLLPKLGINPKAIGETPHHLNTVFRTNVQSAYQAGHWDALQDPFVQSVFGYLQYHAVMDGGTTPFCAFYDGKVWKIDNPIARTLFPPNHYNCRSDMMELTEEEARVFNIQDGFLELKGNIVKPQFESSPADFWTKAA